ncbi:MAG: hypothetical protein KTR28_08445 [Micavibrio sp.]|nr:hypothetical protein [Micavibrio sp.]
MAGGGAVICSPEGKIEKTFSFELNHLGVTESLDAELWTAVNALKVMDRGSVGRIICDNQTAVNAMEKVLTGKSLNQRWDENLRADILRLVANQPNMVIERNMTRGQGKIPLADGFFAKAAARCDQNAIDKQIRRAGNFPHTHISSLELLD